MVVDLRKANPVSVRFQANVKDAIEKAAKDDSRSLSGLIEKVMSDWLIEKGYLEK